MFRNILGRSWCSRQAPRSCPSPSYHITGATLDVLGRQAASSFPGVAGVCPQTLKNSHTFIAGLSRTIRFFLRRKNFATKRAVFGNRCSKEGFFPFFSPQK